MLMAMEITVPMGPATGRKVEPGIMKAPQPMMQPKAIAQTSSGDRYLSYSLMILLSSISIPPPRISAIWNH